MRRTPCLRATLCLALFLTGGLGALSTTAIAGEHVYSVGIVPQHAASKIARTWTPILDWLSERTGYRLKVATARDIPEFEYRLAQEVYDFAYMNPYHFIVFNKKPGYQALARQKGKQIHGILVARKDSTLTRVEELQGERLAFPSPAAFAASILPRGNLRQASVDFTPLYVSSHDSVYMAVANGLTVAGGGVVRTLNNMPDSVREQLQILWKSDGYTPHALAVHPRVPQAVVDAVRTALLEMGDNPEAMELLRALSFKQGFVAADNADWDDVRTLEVDDSHAVRGVE